MLLLVVFNTDKCFLPALHQNGTNFMLIEWCVYFIRLLHLSSIFFPFFMTSFDTFDSVTVHGFTVRKLNTVERTMFEHIFMISLVSLPICKPINNLQVLLSVNVKN